MPRTCLIALTALVVACGGGSPAPTTAPRGTSTPAPTASTGDTGRASPTGDTAGASSATTADTATSSTTTASTADTAAGASGSTGATGDTGMACDFPFGETCYIEDGLCIAPDYGPALAWLAHASDAAIDQHVELVGRPCGSYAATTCSDGAIVLADWAVGTETASAWVYDGTTRDWVGGWLLTDSPYEVCSVCP